MILMSKYKGKHGGKKGQKIRAGVSPPPFSGNAQKKTFFFREGFPNGDDECPQLQVFDANKDGKLQLSEMAK